MQQISILLQTFVLTISICCLQEIFSSKYTPRNFATNSLLNGTLSMYNEGKIIGISFLFLVEWKDYFVLEIFKESLLALNQVATFLSSAFIVSKRFSIFEPEINKFVSSANIIRVSLFQLVKRSFIYMRNKSGPRMEPCGKPQVIRQHILFSYLLSHTNCCWWFK